MKRHFLFITVALFAMTACDKNSTTPTPPVSAEITEVSVDASAKGSVWHYFSFAENKIVGSDKESPETNKGWFAKKNWDIAINRYSIRTNSGDATTVGAKGGVSILDAGATFAALTSLPSNVSFKTDKPVTERGMGGSTTTIIKSEATVILFKKNDNGSLVMPPVYLPAPLYIFRSADGLKYYKVEFTQYLDENDVSGKVKFKFSEIK